MTTEELEENFDKKLKGLTEFLFMAIRDLTDRVSGLELQLDKIEKYREDLKVTASYSTSPKITDPDLADKIKKSFDENPQPLYVDTSPIKEPPMIYPKPISTLMAPIPDIGQEDNNETED